MYRIDNVNLEEEERIIVSRLIGSLVKLDDVASVLLGGSIVKSKGVYKQKKSGIDLIVLINEKSSDYKIIKRLREVGLDFYLSDDIFILKGTLISIYIEMYNSYVKYLESIITSEAMEIVLKDWTIGGVCKEVILDDIANAKIFFDERGNIAELSHKLKKEYLLSDSYGRSLIVQLKNKINLTMMQYDEQNIILFHIGFWECIVLAERLYCHKMKIYNPGFKHILKQKNFLRRFDLNDIDLKNVYTIKMKEILEKLNELYKEGKN